MFEGPEFERQCFFGGFSFHPLNQSILQVLFPQSYSA